MNELHGTRFPSQRVSYQEKQKADWYANCCDYVIEAGISARGDLDIDEKFNILQGNIPEQYYKKALNPYNSKDPKFTRFPASMRNYDMMQGVIRRYIGEYIKNPHDFIVGANNPEVVFARDAELNRQIMIIIENAIAEKIQESYQQFINEGNDPAQFNSKESIDIEKFITDFKENYIDDISAQGQELINVIDDLTDSMFLYTRAYFEYITIGMFFTYSDVVGNKLIKRVVSCRDAYPVPTNEPFVKDFDMFAERRMLTKQQIMDEFADYLTKDQIKYIDDFYQYSTSYSSDTALISFNKFKNLFPDVCQKFSPREIDNMGNVMARDSNNGLYEVWHTVWRGEVKQGILTYDNGGFIAQRIVNEDYVFNTDNGDIDIEWKWVPQVYECDRLFGRSNSIYPYKARPIAYNRDGQLPYNGLIELVPGFGRFSIVDIMLPYQVFRNIVCYHREMAIAKNKNNILLIAKSLLGQNPEKTIYHMAADGVLYIDDENDSNLLKTQQIRMLAADMRDYINQLSQLIAEIENSAMMQVDMTPQRFGAIANSAGKGVTDEAIMRGSMGSVIIEFLFDKCREKDYQRDMDYTKLAWIDGLNTSYKTKDGEIRYMSLDVNNHIFADYIVTCKNSIKEREKLEQYKNLAFSAAQNGNMDMANAAIRSDNVAQISKWIDKFQNIQREHEMNLEQVRQQTEQTKQQYEIEKIHIKAEEERETEKLKAFLEGEIEAMKLSGNALSFDNDLGTAEKVNAEKRIEDARNNLEREKIAIDARSKDADRNVKMMDIAAKMKMSEDKVKIAKENKNKYDINKKKTK